MKYAFVFPGQGSQSIGMMSGFGENTVIRQTFEEASEALGEDLWQMMQDGPAERLSLTVNTQPLMLTAGVACYRAWRAAGGGVPSMVAGHSLGEYSALVAAGVLAFKDAVPLVRYRAQAMQEAVPAGQGAMAALLGLDDESARAACAEAAQEGVVDAVNFNGPGQVVIAGHKAAVERAIEVAKAKGAKRAMLLPVSAPFHSALMAPVAARLAERLKTVTLNTPEIAVVNNVDVAQEKAPERIRDALVRQADHPVRWTEVVQAMSQAGMSAIVECGPGKVLAGMTKRIAPDALGGSILDAATLDAMLTTLAA